jgi:hypothetical protein
MILLVGKGFEFFTGRFVGLIAHADVFTRAAQVVTVTPVELV